MVLPFCLVSFPSSDLTVLAVRFCVKKQKRAELLAVSEGKGCPQHSGSQFPAPWALVGQFVHFC